MVEMYGRYKSGEISRDEYLKSLVENAKSTISYYVNAKHVKPCNVEDAKQECIFAVVSHMNEYNPALTSLIAYFGLYFDKAIERVEEVPQLS